MKLTKKIFLKHLNGYYLKYRDNCHYRYSHILLDK